MGGEIIHSIEREHDVPPARRIAKELCQQIAANPRKCHQLMTAVSELANNLCLHATHGGTLHFSIARQGSRLGVEVISRDDGPGIADIGAALTDGYSTNGGLGGGLPGARRLTDDFEIHSVVGQGTRVLIRIWAS